MRGLRDQMEIDGRLNKTGAGCVFEVEEGEREMVFTDEVTGEITYFFVLMDKLGIQMLSLPHSF